MPKVPYDLQLLPHGFCSHFPTELMVSMMSRSSGDLCLPTAPCSAPCTHREQSHKCPSLPPPHNPPTLARSWTHRPHPLPSSLPKYDGICHALHPSRP